MNPKTLLTIICIMVSTTICFAQKALKQGVYFSHSDTTLFGGIKAQSVRELTVKNDTAVIYKIVESQDNVVAVSGISGEYALQLETVSEHLYKVKNSDIELNITVIDTDTVEVEIIGGTINYCYSGGQYLEYTLPLLPEKRRLTFIKNEENE